MRRLLLILLTVVAVAAVAYPQGLNNNEVQFTGTITAALPNGEGLGTLFVQIDTVNLRVLVNPKTEIGGPGDTSLTMDQLAEKVSQLVEVTGKFSSSGILANSVKVLGPDDDSNMFDVHGHITGVAPYNEGTALSLLGLTILVPTVLHIQSDGAEVPIASLTTGTRIHATGAISDTGAWTADSVEVVVKGKKKGTLKFEGVVESYEPTTGLLKVAVNGATGNVTNVNVTSGTEVTGDLVAGAYVEVKGVMVDLTVNAKEVNVIGPLELKPEVRKLKVGKTGTFTVKLRETAVADVNIALTIASGAGVVSLPRDSVVVPKGSRTADFTVEALVVGTATVKAEALGGSATATVLVGEVSEDDSERPDGSVRIVFAPGHIKLAPGESRDVVLLIQPAQSTTPELLFPPAGPVTAEPDRPLGQGVASMKVKITASATAEGTYSISVTLPASLGSGKAELLVEVQSKGKK